MKLSVLQRKLRLLNVGRNAKTVKSDHGNFLTAVMYLAPSDLAGPTVCPMAKLARCEAGCLNTAGRGAINSVQAARIRKTQWFQSDREGFLRQLVTDIKLFAEYCRDNGKRPAVRLNGTSDVMWEKELLDGRTVIDRFPMVQFYDYTKISKRSVPANHAVVWSFSGADPRYSRRVHEAAKSGINIAVVFRDKVAVSAALGQTVTLGGEKYTVIDGDRDDLRFLDPPRSIVALYAKGAAKSDRSGFVVESLDHFRTLI